VVSLLSISVCLGLLSLLVTSFLVIDRYYWQTNSKRYHFLKIDASLVKVIGNSWMWFYHGVGGISGIPFISRDTKVRKQEEGVFGYLAGASFYFDHFIKATPRDMYIENLRHTYLLLIHNAYKNKFDAQLTRIMTKGTRITFFIVLGTMLLSFLCWRYTGIQFSVNENKSTIELGTDTLRVRLNQTPTSVKSPLVLPTAIEKIKNPDSLVNMAGKMNLENNKTDSLTNTQVASKSKLSSSIEKQKRSGK